jgi:hypothetical protein
LKAIKYPDQGYRVSENKDRLNEIKVILANRFIDNNSNLDLIFYIIPDNIDSLIISIKTIKEELYIDKI